MVGCSLTEAFPDTEQSGKRKEERKKVKKGPALSFLQKDPDRQAERPPSEDVIGKERVLPKATTASQLTDPTHTSDGEPVPSYFGKGDEDGFADFNKVLSDSRGYTIEGSDFMKGFNGKGLDKATGGQLPLPSLNDNWKPISPTGVQSSFTHPANTRSVDSSFSKDEKETLLKKLDTLFARLEELETKRNEYAHAEVTLFILSGLFLVFSLDSMRKFR